MRRSRDNISRKEAEGAATTRPEAGTALRVRTFLLFLVAFAAIRRKKQASRSLCKDERMQRATVRSPGLPMTRRATEVSTRKVRTLAPQCDARSARSKFKELSNEFYRLFFRQCIFLSTKKFCGESSIENLKTCSKMADGSDRERVMQKIEQVFMGCQQLLKTGLRPAMFLPDSESKWVFLCPVKP